MARADALARVKGVDHGSRFVDKETMRIRNRHRRGKRDVEARRRVVVICAP
jgi:hypothetical protein